MKKINMFVGRLQPITQGHINCINEGDAPCIVYRINSSNKIPDNIKGWKVGGRVVKKDSIEHVIDFLNAGGKGDLNEQEKELLKRPFTNELIAKELEIVKRNNKNIIDVVPVVNMFDALMKFNKFITDHSDEYEPQYLMCGDDRVDAYTENIDKYDELDDDWNSGKKIPNVLKGILKTNTGKGRTEGVSGTAVRKSIITKDKSAFEKIMPKGVGVMFDDFVNAFDEFKNKLQRLIKEMKMTSLKNYIIEKREEKLFEASGLNGAKEDIIVYSSKTNKEIMVKQYANSKETWKKFESFYNQLIHFNLMKYSRIYIAKKENDKWIADVNKNYQINDYQPNNMYLYSSKKNFYTYKQIIEMLESGEYIVVLSENKHYNR